MSIASEFDCYMDYYLGSHLELAIECGEAIVKGDLSAEQKAILIDEYNRSTTNMIVKKTPKDDTERAFFANCIEIGTLMHNYEKDFSNSEVLGDMKKLLSKYQHALHHFRAKKTL